MAVPEDLGPLSWVIGEIQKSLESTGKLLRRFAREATSGALLADPAPLRIARHQLHQTVGALQLVGHAAPALLLGAMEYAVQGFAAEPARCTEGAVQRIERAGFAVTDFLQALLAGKKMSSVALFPQYRDVLELVSNERIHPADLWGEPWHWVDIVLPSRQPALVYDPAVRSKLDREVLKVIKSGDEVSARRLQELCLGLSRGTRVAHAASFWTLAAAFFEGIALALLPADVYVKRAASRVLLQYATLARNDSTVSDRLAQDLLFFCAQAAPGPRDEAPVLRAVRAAWNIQDACTVDYTTEQFGRFDPQVLAQARKRIEAAKEMWTALSGGDLTRLRQVADSFAQLGESLQKLHPPSQPMAQALNDVVDDALRTGRPPGTELAMEVATSVLYLEAAFQDLDPQDRQFTARTVQLAGRIQRARDGGQSEPLEPWMEELYHRVSERQTMGTVVDELRSHLADLEKSLDQFFRHPAEKGLLRGVPTQLLQMRGVLSVLGLSQAVLAVQRMRDTVERLLTEQGSAGGVAGDFDSLGNNLGALGFLIDMLGYQPALAKRLFVFDERTGELKPLMGRQAGEPGASVPATVVAPKPVQAPAASAVSPIEEFSRATESWTAKITGPVPLDPVPDTEVTELDEEDLQSIFLAEAREVQQGARAALDRLAEQPADVGEMTVLRRAFHTLKGSSRMVGLTEFGEAAWAMEQVLNTWLADQRPATPELLAGARQALGDFAGWVEAIAAGTPHSWQATPFQKLADALRTDVQATTPGLDALNLAMRQSTEEPAPVPAESDAFEATDFLGIDGHLAASAPAPLIPAAPDAFAPTDFLDIDGHPPASAPAPLLEDTIGFSALARAPADRPATDPDSDARRLAAADEVTRPADAGSPRPAERELADAPAATSDGFPPTAFLDEPEFEPPAVSSPPATLAGAEDIDFGALQRVPREPSAASAPAHAVPPPVPAPSEPPTPAVTETAEITEAAEAAEVTHVAAAAEVAPEPSAGAPPAQAPEEAVPSAADVDDDGVKVIGPLRIGIALYNVYLNEADEWSRQLGIEVGEWALQPHVPVPESTIALAHSLAGSSATVGFSSLSRIARAFEAALQHLQLKGDSSAQQGAVLTAAADELRRLLHQFAAGFLKEPEPGVLQSLHDLAAVPLSAPPQQPPVEPLTTVEEALPAPVSPPAAQEPVDHEPVAEAPAPAPAPSPAPSQPLGVEPAVPAASPAVVAVSQLPVVQLPPVSQARHQVVLEDGEDNLDLSDAVDAELFPVFEEEAAELLPRLSGALRQWAQHPGDASPRALVLRTLHTLKGSARLAGAMRLGERAHRMESEVEHIGGAQQPADRDAVERLLARFDALQAGFEALRTADGAVQAEPKAPAPEAAAGIASVVSAARAAGAPLDAEGMPAGDAPQAPEVAAAQPVSPVAAAGAAPTTGPALPTPAALAGTRTASNQAVRIRTQLLDRLVTQAGEVIITRSRLEAELGQLRSSLDDLTGNLDRLRRQLRDIEVQAESQMQSRLAQAKDSQQAFDPLEFDRFTRVQELTRMMAESVNDVATVQRTLQRTVQTTEDDLAAQARQTRELQHGLLRTRMVEFEGLSERLYRVVRQAAKESGKQVRLDITGGAIEMDRGVLERMTPAFEHLLRNSVVHGIEPAAARVQAGKGADGLIRIELRHEGNDVSLSFADDGAGLDLPRIAERARALGLLAPGHALPDEQAAQLIYQPGFSTAGQVSELAGRGIGMDVVRAEVAALGGRIETHSTPGQGIRFTLVLPLTTAVTHVVMLRAGEMTIGVPSNLVELVQRTSADELARDYASGHHVYDGEPMPFYWAGALLQQSARSDAPPGKTNTVVVVRSAAQRLALHVDGVLGNQEVVVKNLGPQLSRLPGMAGITVLASGAVTLIYNPVALAGVHGERARALQASAGAPQPAAAGLPHGAGHAKDAAAAPQQVPLVLVVDDSITVRRVTQRLLQREGYRVALAADGLQALERLQQERPVVVLSDIEMPRMDGFDLARNIRADQALADLPIIMITSRIAEKHREHARQLGISHYLGKPYSEEQLLRLVHSYARPQAADALVA